SPRGRTEMNEPQYLMLCPQCNRPLSVSGTLLGQRGRCPHCGASFAVDAAAVDALEAIGFGEPPAPVGWDDANRPWEQPGIVRRDCVSHRGRLILTLGVASAMCAMIVAVTTLYAVVADMVVADITLLLAALVALLALPGLTLGTAIWV